MPRSRRSPTRMMAALRHGHCRVLIEVKGKAVWILNVLVDATVDEQKRRTNTAAWWTFTQGKGREGQSVVIALWRRQLQTKTHDGVMPTPPPPSSCNLLHTSGRGGSILGAANRLPPTFSWAVSGGAQDRSGSSVRSAAVLS